MGRKLAKSQVSRRETRYSVAQENSSTAFVGMGARSKGKPGDECRHDIIVAWLTMLTLLR